MRYGYGPHLMLDLNECDQDKISDLELCRFFLDTTPEIMSMKKITEPNVFWYRPVEKEEEGITGMVIIAESHLSIHTYPHKKFAFIDLFSCKPFDIKFSVDYIVNLFGSKDPIWSVNYRGERFERHLVKDICLAK